MKRKYRLGALALAAIGISTMGTPAGADPAINFTNDKVDRIISSGSDTTYFVMNDLGQAYMESEGCNLSAVDLPLLPGSPTQNTCQPAPQANVVKEENYDHDVVFNYFPQGSNAGRRQLCAQSDSPPRDARVPFVDIARSSSPPAQGFQCSVANGAPTAGVVLRFIAFAKDALTWAYWPGQPAGVTNLTQAQLNDIFVDCTLTHWNQTAFAAPYPAASGEHIRVFTAIAASGSRSVWDGFVGGNSENCIPAGLKDGSSANGERVVREHQAQPVEEAVNDADAANEANSIFFFSVGIHNVSPAQAQNSLIGNVNGIVPTEANIQSGTFPFSRLLYNVIRNSGAAPVASGATRRFTNSSLAVNDQSQGFLCKPDQAHAEPVGTPGLGIENPAASKDYGKIVPQILRDNGLVPLIPDADETNRRCTFTDVTVP